MIDEKKIPQRIYIKDYQLAECEIEGVADARINAVPYKGGSGKLCEYINVDNLWHDASEEPEHSRYILAQRRTFIGELRYYLYKTNSTYPWELNVRDLRITKWCYIDDILPLAHDATKGGDK